MKSYHKDILRRAEFKGRLAGTAIDFGYIALDNLEEFFEFCIHYGYLSFTGLHTQKPPNQDFYVYKALKPFVYSAPWIQDSSERLTHKIIGRGTVLVSKDYLAIGYEAERSLS